jgi:Galactosyltransferase
VQQNCPTVPFVVKVDDDVSFNLGLLISHLQRAPDPLNLVGGHTYENATPFRGLNSEFYTPPSMWPANTFYPTYVSGAFYILGSSVREALFQGAMKTEMIFHMEDIFVTGIVREKFTPWIEVTASFIGRNRWGCGSLVDFIKKWSPIMTFG